MSRLKPLQIISSFNKEELLKFSQLVNSPFFNRSKDLIKLFSIVKNYYPEFDADKIKFEKLYLKLYPGKKYNEGTIRNLFSDLKTLSEKFLAFVNYEESSEYGLKIITELNERHLDKDFEKNYKKYYEKNENEEDALYKKNLNKFLLKSEMLSYKQRLNIDFKKNEYSSVFESLFAFFLNEFHLVQLSRLNITDWYKNKEEFSIIDTFFEFTDVGKILERLKENSSTYYDDMKLLYYLNKAARNRDGNFSKSYEEAYKIFNQQIGGMSKQTQVRIYIAAINVINMNIKSSDRELSKIKFALEKEMIEKEIGMDSMGKMSAGMFSHIVHDAIAAGEIKWAEEFLENKIDSVADAAKYKDDIYFYYKAKILSSQKKFRESNEILLKIKKEDNTFKADSKILRLINFYEEGDMEAGFSHAEAIRQLLIRNDEAYIGRKELSSNFVKFYLVLIRKKTGKDTDLYLAKKELEECKVVRNKAWLMEKFEELL
jgi:hypothetical protein